MVVIVLKPLKTRVTRAGGMSSPECEIARTCRKDRLRAQIPVPRISRSGEILMVHGIKALGAPGLRIKGVAAEDVMLRLKDYIIPSGA
jgi:hypothetical protein